MTKLRDIVDDLIDAVSTDARRSGSTPGGASMDPDPEVRRLRDLIIGTNRNESGAAFTRRGTNPLTGNALAHPGVGVLYQSSANEGKDHFIVVAPDFDALVRVMKALDWTDFEIDRAKCASVLVAKDSPKVSVSFNAAAPTPAPETAAWVYSVKP